MTKKRTYSDDLRPNSSNSRKSSNGSITISIDSRSYSIDSRSYSIDSRSYSIDSRSYSIDSRSYSIDSRSYSIDSNDEIKCGSFEEEKYSKKERKNSNPLLDFLMENNNKKQNIRRLREMKAYSKSPDEPKTIEQVQKMLYIFKNSKK
jgi:hypothetical protein